jgi:acetylornithine deacetylase/succinyl-diaminopimelate desuccinylase-like protein
MSSEAAGNIDRELDDYITANLPRFIAELGTLCSPTTIQSSRRSKNDPDDTTRLIINMLKERGLKTENWSLNKRSTIFARGEQRSESNTLLSYNTYEIMPPGQMDEWQSAMFGLNERDGKLYAKGVADNRANLVARLAAYEAWREVYGSVPCNVKFLVEGRTGDGQSLASKLLGEKSGVLKADACLWDSGENTPEGIPVIGLGQKGYLCIELRSKTLSQDGNSALSGILPSGGWRLIWAMSAIKNDNEDIQIDDFDADIQVPSHEDSTFIMQTAKRYTNRLEERLTRFGVSEYLMGLKSIPLLITEFFTPTANITGFEGGYLGDDVKTVLMSSGHARLDFRLVPNQDPATALDLIRKHLYNRGYTDIEVTQVGVSEKPVRTSPTHPFVKLAIESLGQAIELAPLVIPLAPTVGPMHAFKEALGDLPLICTGTYYDGAQRQTANENIRIADFLNHIKFTTRLLGNLNNYTRSDATEKITETVTSKQASG